MKFIYAFVLTALCITVFSTANARDFGILGIPEPVTVTTTDMAKDAYTLLLDSDDPCAKFYITNMDASQDVTVTYNNLTYTVVDDFIVVAAGATIERDGQVPDGVYCGVTQNTVGTVGVSVKYESWK